jgi:hypothetical protein
VRDSALAILAELHAAGAVPLAAAGESDGESDRRIVELAALLHDVCDHKYCDPETGGRLTLPNPKLSPSPNTDTDTDTNPTDEGRGAIRRRDECLRSAASAEESELVLAIVEGVSFSKVCAPL